MLTEQRGAIVHTYTRLWVAKDGVPRSVQLDDDAYFGTASFVRWRDWLLVLNDDNVMGGYDYSTNRLYGEGQWEQLPFTVRSSAGEVVASKRVYDGMGALPASFPRIPEPPPSTQPATSP